MIHWVRKGSGLQKMSAAGWSNANNQLQAQLEVMGVLDDDAPVAVHFGVPTNFWPIEGKTNVLWTMWESPWQLTDSVAPTIAERRPDFVVVPCDWCRDGLRELLPDIPCATVPLGYDDHQIEYRRRRWRPRQGRFRVGFLGAPNYRKYSVAREVFSFLHSHGPLLRARGLEFEFYWKFSGETTNEHLERAKAQLGDACEEVEPGLLRGRKGSRAPDGLPGDDWVIDNRFVSRAEIADLYQSFHLFLALHTGEGFGLNALEAMASGCPTIVTDYSGTQQFADARGCYLVPATETQVQTLGPSGAVETKRAVLPDVQAAIEATIEIMGDYYAATERAKRGAELVRGLTWQNSAAALCDTLAKFGILKNVSTR